MKQVREILTETIDNNDAEDDPNSKSHYEDILSKSTGRFDSKLFQCRTVAEAISILRVVKLHIHIYYMSKLCMLWYDYIESIRVELPFERKNFEFFPFCPFYASGFNRCNRTFSLVKKQMDGSLDGCMVYNCRWVYNCKM